MDQTYYTDRIPDGVTRVYDGLGDRWDYCPASDLWVCDTPSGAQLAAPVVDLLALYGPVSNYRVSAAVTA